MRPARGELRVYLGAAPGVGKTYAALAEARRRRGRGTDVVVGLVETHGRPRTADLLRGLELIPRTIVVHRGTQLGELDVDAVLARAPEVCVVDELAHSCAPGSRHAKRWEDVEELLDAGIDVISTVNVQHLESLGEVVERITGVRPQETIPDAVVRAADQIELVDITPEALRGRMLQGEIYRPERIDEALAHYFRSGNLIALRELALLWVADQVDVALQRYRTESEVAEVWETRERVVVGVSGGPESATVLHRAARIARRLGADDLICVHVLRADGLAGGRRDAARAVELRRVAAHLGASIHTIVGDDVPATLLSFARGVNATQLVLGTSRRRRWERLTEADVADRAVAGSGDIDVHLVTHEHAAGGRDGGGRAPRGGLDRGVVHGRRIARWPVAVTILVGGALVLLAATTPRDVVLAPGHVAAAGAALLATVVLAMVAARGDRRWARAQRTRAETALLSSFAHVTLGEPDPLPRLLERVREAFGLDEVALLERREHGRWTTVAATGDRFPDRLDEADVDVAVGTDLRLVGIGRTPTAAERQLVEVAAGQAMLALRRGGRPTQGRAGTVTTTPVPVPCGAPEPRTRAALGDVLVRVLRQVEPARTEMTLTVAEVPELLVDADLAEGLLLDLVEDALRRTRPDYVSVHLEAVDGHVVVRVVESTPDAPHHRGDHLVTASPAPTAEPPDAASGLHAAGACARALGGSLRAERTPGGDLARVLTLPAPVVPGGPSLTGPGPLDPAASIPPP